MFTKILWALPLAILLVISCGKKEGIHTITPPLSKVAVSPTEKEIDPTVSQVVKFNDNFSVQVPANAFKDKDGNIITEPIKLSLKEYNDPATIIASGIPMVVNDENGTEQQMESAGMFDIRGTTQGKEVFIADGKNLNISTQSKIKGNDFDAYYFEETVEDNGQASGTIDRKGKWKLISPKKEETSQANVSKRDSFNLSLDTARNSILSLLSDVNWQCAFEHKYANPSKIDSLKNETWKTVNFIQSDKTTEITNLSAGENSTVAMTSIKKTPFIINYDKGEINIINTNTVLKFPPSKKFRGKLFDWKDGSFTLRASETTIFYNAKGEKLFDFDGTFIVYKNAEFNTYFLNSYKDSKFHLIDQKGKELFNSQTDSLSEVLFKQDKVMSEREDAFYSSEFSGFITKNNGPKSVISANGKQLFNEEQLKGKFKGVSKDNRFLVVLKPDNLLHVYDKKSNSSKTIDPGFNDKKSEIEKFSLKVSHIDGNKILFKKSLTYLYEGDERDFPLVMWDLEQNEKVKDYGLVVSFYNYTSDYLMVNYPDNSRKLFDKSGNQILIQITNPSPPKSFEGNYILEDKKAIKLVNNKGGLIKNFSDFDASISRFDVIKDLIFTSTDNGTIYCWDKNAKLKWSLNNQLSEDRRIRQMGSKLLYCEGRQGISYFDINGQMQYHTSGFYAIPGKDDFSKVYFIGRRTLGVLEAQVTNQPLPANVYEIQMSNKKRVFISNIVANEEQKVIIEQYQKAVKEKGAKRKARRKREKKFTRQLVIKNFGLYNYDRFYKNPNAIVFKANFDIEGLEVANSEITVFQVTGLNSKAIIQYYDHSFDKFSIMKNFPNQLLVILPDEKVALFSQEEFNKLDLEKIKQDKTFTFKMKSLDKVESADKLNDILNPEAI